MRVFIIAAGVGSRLRPWTNLIPKPLLPVGSVPCISIIVRRLMRQGFDDIVVCVNEKQLPKFRHELRDWDLQYSANPKPLGTAGEILNAREFVEDDFLIHYGDVLTGVNLKELVGFHWKCVKREDGLGTLALVNKLPLEVGTVSLRGYHVREIREKPTLPLTFWAGIAVLKPDVLDCAKIGDDFAMDVFPKILKEGGKLYGYMEPNAKWIDIGNTSQYRRAIELAEKGLIK